MEEPRVAFLTFPSPGAAKSFARRLVEGRLAACVNLVPGIFSVYAWKGAIETDEEWLAVVKTRAEHLAAIEELLREHHPYDTPELIAFAPEHVEARYSEWWGNSTELGRAE